MTKPDEEQPALPGMAPPRTSTQLRQAVETTLAALERDGLLEERHAAMAQLALELADAVAGARRGRASGVAMASRELRETLLALPAPIAADVAAKFQEFVESLLKEDG